MGSLDERLRRSPDTNTPTIDTDKSTDTETRRRVPSRAKLLGSAVGAREAIILAFPAFAGAQDTPPASVTPANEGVPNTPAQVDQPSETRAVTATTARYDDKTTWPTIPPENKEAWPTWGYFARSPWSGENSRDLKITNTYLKQPALGTRHIPFFYDTTGKIREGSTRFEYKLNNYDIASCIKMNTARGGNSSKESLGIAYKFKPSVISTSVGSFARLRLGLADMQLSDFKTGDGNHRQFEMACETVATESVVSVDLVKKIGKKAFKVVQRASESQNLRLKKPGFKGFDYIDRLYGGYAINDRGRGLNKGLRSSQLEWSSVRFPISKRDLGKYAFRVTVISRPLDEVSCDDLKEQQPGSYREYKSCVDEYWPKKVYKEKNSRIISLKKK